MRRAARRSGREGGWRREGEDYSDNLLLSVPGGTPFSPHCIYLWCERKHKWKLLFIMLLLIILLSGLGLNLTMGVLGNSEKDCSESLLAMTCEKKTHWTVFCFISVYIFGLFFFAYTHISVANAPLLLPVQHMQQCCLVGQLKMKLYSLQLESAHVLLDLRLSLDVLIYKHMNL